MSIPLVSIHRSRCFGLARRLNRELLLAGLGYVDVLDGRYVAVLRRG